MKIMVAMLAGGILLFSVAAVRAQEPVPPPGPSGPLLAPSQVDQLAGPIALYPDPLIAEILPAATFPTEIVEADRYVGQGGDPNEIAAQGWDPSIQALCHYPNILKWMDDNLAWSTQLGQAFQNQQADVMNSIQQLRAKAQGLGNLPSTPQESVVTDDGDIEIEPTDPDDMYVPSYPPDTIYDEAGVYCTFPYELPLGIWLGYDWNWHNHRLIAWGAGNPRPSNWWHQTPVERHAYLTGHPAPVWHGGGGLAVGARGGWERGFSTPPQHSPLVINVRPAPAYRPPETSFRQPAATFRAPAQTFRQPEARPAERPEEARSAPSEGFFVGGQSGHEAVESSARGQSSRAAMGGGGGGGGGRGGHR